MQGSNSAASPVSYSSGAQGAARKVKPRNLLPNSEGIAADEISASNSYSIGTVDTDEKNPIRHTQALKLKQEIFADQEQSQESDFYTQILDETSSMGKIKDPSKVGSLNQRGRAARCLSSDLMNPVSRRPYCSMLLISS
jgi:hypothetical protein